MRTAAFVAALALTALVVSPSRASAYSVLAHEATIDVCWDSSLKPLLLRRYPRTTAEELNRARAFAYGGSVIQDLGYYPFGNKFFSNLTHYVRSGDFVEALLRESTNVDELAFALGALAHYNNDTTGHPESVNRAVPMAFPKLRQKFGDSITYTQAPQQHVRVEFSFDIVQVARGAYLPDAYKQLIGFEVAAPLLDRAFRATYGLGLEDVLTDSKRAISTYRYSVSQLFPIITKAAWRDKQDEIATAIPNAEQGKFVFAYGRAEFERDYGREYQKPKLFARFVGVLYRILPKIGPLKQLDFKAPTPQAEALFVKSFQDATARYRAAVRDLADWRFNIGNLDFDTGRRPAHGEYSLADDTYARLLDELSQRDFANTPLALKGDVLSFYGANPQPSQANKHEQKHWDDVRNALRDLAAAPTSN